MLPLQALKELVNFHRLAWRRADVERHVKTENGPCAKIHNELCPSPEYSIEERERAISRCLLIVLPLTEEIPRSRCLGGLLSRT